MIEIESVRQQNFDFRTIRLLLTSCPPLIALALIEFSIFTWTAYDKSIPCWDTASHKLNSFYVFELLQHPNLNHLDWYRHIFAVSQLYPPLFYILSASLKFILGESINSELISNMLFAIALFYSLHYIAKIVFQNKIAALIAPTLVFLYPAVFWATHCALLDFASIAMVSLGIAYLLWWTQSPQLGKSVLLGIVLGLATLTKNNTPIFFFGPLLIEFILNLRKNDGKPDYFRLKQLMIVGTTTFVVILPWLILAGPIVSQFIASLQQQNCQVANNISQSSIAAKTGFPYGYINEFFSHLFRFSLQDLPLILSPILFLFFLVSLFKIRPLDRNKLYLLTSIFFSILTASAFHWPHQFRYIVPTTVPIAALSAGLFANLWLNRSILYRIGLLSLSIIAILQITFESFAPYPLSFPAWTKIFMQIMHEEFKTKSGMGQMPGVSINPLPELDSGILWSMKNIEDTINYKSVNKPIYLMIMPNADPINCSPYYYLTKTRKDNIEVASPREHTELGDKVDFDRNKALYYQWYILKTGDQGIRFCDQKSLENYSRWLEFVHFSGLYTLVNKKLLSDGSTLELYKQANSIN